MKILVVDDHPLVRDAMFHVLSQLAESVTLLDACDCASGLAQARAHPDIDLVLLDLNLPGTRGFEALDQFHSQHPMLPVVILSMVRDRESVLQAIRHGAMGFIPKVADREVIVGAARLVLSGGLYLPPEVMGEDGPGGGTAGWSGTEPRSLADLGLTPRQGEVLSLVMLGRTNKEICRDLGLAERTVKMHVTAILTALKVSTRTQAVIAAGRMGFERAPAPPQSGP